MCRKRLLEHLGNLSDKYPVPTCNIQYFQYSTFGEFEICEFCCHQHSETFISDHPGSAEYKDVKLVNGFLTQYVLISSLLGFRYESLESLLFQK